LSSRAVESVMKYPLQMLFRIEVYPERCCA